MADDLKPEPNVTQRFWFSQVWTDQTLPYPQQVVVHEQESFEAAGVIQDDGLGAQAALHGLIWVNTNK